MYDKRLYVIKLVFNMLETEEVDDICLPFTEFHVKEAQESALSTSLVEPVT